MKKVVVLLSLMIPLLWSCNIENLDDPIIVGNVEDEIYLDLFEELSLPNRGLTLRMETIEMEDCLNATLETDHTRGPTRLSLEILQVLPPGECDLGLAPAKGVEEVGILANTNYSFLVNIRNTVDSEGTLEVTEDAIRLSFPTENGFRLRTPELLRIPDDLIWGYVEIPATGNEAGAREIIEEIGAIAENHTLIQGYYGYFQTDNQGEFFIIENNPDRQHLSYGFKYSASETELINKLASLRSIYTDYPIFLLNQKGEQL